MRKTKVPFIHRIRGIAIAGVIGIHVGSYVLADPKVSLNMLALLEIATRFSVPIFFFVSGFGLFYSLPLNCPFDYFNFYLRRAKAVLLPYLIWSVLYWLHNQIAFSVQAWPTSLADAAKQLAFGLASYQLYFLVILMWFYLLMPLWRPVTAWIVLKPLPRLGGILAGQIIFNYCSSYIWRPTFGNPILDMAIEYRFHWWVLHYVFIFLLGATSAVLYPWFESFLQRNSKIIISAFPLSLAGMLLPFYYLVVKAGYTAEDAINTVHQLHPAGVIYTVAAALFFCLVLQSAALSHRPAKFLDWLGDHAFAIYLIHPAILSHLSWLFMPSGIGSSGVLPLLFFLTTLLASLICAVVLTTLGNAVPWLSLLLLGKSKVQR